MINYSATVPGEDQLDVKRFMEDHDIQPIPPAHFRIATALTASALTVLAVERSGYAWCLKVDRYLLRNAEIKLIRKLFRRILSGAGIALKGHEPLIAIEGRVVLALFNDEEGDIGIGVKFHAYRRGKLERVFELYSLDPPENYPAHHEEDDLDDHG